LKMPRSDRQIVSVPFRVSSGQSFSATVNTTVATTLALAPVNLGNRASTVGNAWEWFRLKAVVVESGTDYGNTFSATDGFCGQHCVSYDSDYESTAPAVISEASQALKFAMGGPRERIRFRMSKRDMDGGVPGGWRHTTSTGSPADDTRFAGVVTFLARTGAVNFAGGGPQQWWIVSGTIEFKNPVATSLSFRRILSGADDAKSVKSIASDAPVFVDETPEVFSQRRMDSGVDASRRARATTGTIVSESSVDSSVSAGGGRPAKPRAELQRVGHPSH